MTKKFIFVKDNVYKKAKKSGGFLYYEKSFCRSCSKEFLKRKQKNNPFCSRKCYLDYPYGGHDSQYGFDNLLKNGDHLDILNGSLISDGCVTKYPLTKNYYFTHTCKHKEYVDFLDECLNFKIYKYFSKRKGGKLVKKPSSNWTIRTPVSYVFSSIRYKWYPNGKKIIPEDVKFTNLMLLHWYLGDGNYNPENGVTLCTDCFDQESIEFARGQFKGMGFDTLLHKRNRIIIPNRNVYEFIEYIGDCPVMCYEHKWNILPKESYKNRICKFCKLKFTAKINSQKFCKSKCYKNNWYKNNKNIKMV